MTAYRNEIWGREILKHISSFFFKNLIITSNSGTGALRITSKESWVIQYALPLLEVSSYPFEQGIPLIHFCVSLFIPKISVFYCFRTTIYVHGRQKTDKFLLHPAWICYSTPSKDFFSKFWKGQAVGSFQVGATMMQQFSGKRRGIWCNIWSILGEF